MLADTDGRTCGAPSQSARRRGDAGSNDGSNDEGRQPDHLALVQKKARNQPTPKNRSKTTRGSKGWAARAAADASAAADRPWTLEAASTNPAGAAAAPTHVEQGTGRPAAEAPQRELSGETGGNCGSTDPWRPTASSDADGRELTPNPIRKRAALDDVSACFKRRRTDAGAIDEAPWLALSSRSDNELVGELALRLACED